MKTINIKIDDKVFEETQKINQLQKRKILGVLLKKESALVCDESMKVLKEFENMDSLPPNSLNA